MAFASRLQLKLRRMSATRFHRKPAAQRSPAPLVSFAFDDFPRSAYTVAGKILAEHGVHATYYVSSGLARKETIMGEMFHREDLTALVAAGHEVACHTFDHVRCCDVESEELLKQCERNCQSLAETIGKYEPRNFSYPEGVVNPSAKRLLLSVYDTCRTTEHGINHGVVDLGFLRANPVYSTCRIEDLKSLIAANVQQKGWLILYTHDVNEHPSRYGCTPDYFREAVSAVLESGAEVLTVAGARERFLPARDPKRISSNYSYVRV